MKRTFTLLAFVMAFTLGIMAQGTLPLSISGTTVQTSKVYDGTTNCDVTYVGSLSGLLLGDVVSVNAVANYATALVSTSNNITVTFTLSGPDASKYDLDTTIVINGGSITPRKIVVLGTVIRPSKTYDGTTAHDILALGSIMNGCGADDVTISGVANFVTPSAGLSKAVVVSYTVSGTDASNYSNPDDGQFTADITPKYLTGTDAVVQKIKQFDGTDDATVLTQAIPHGIVMGDSVTMLTTAYYDDAFVGRNKNITLHYDLTGPQSLNYNAPVDVLYAPDGQILAPTVIFGDKVDVNVDGYCQGDNGEVTFTVSSGEPTSYLVTFASDALAQGFSNVGWQAMNSTTNKLYLNVPSNCANGTYHATVTFRNDANVTTTPINFVFTVNLSEDYTVAIFDDVVSIDNRDNLFFSYQWYHNGVAIDGATLPYYQEEGGLTGDYYVRVNLGTPSEARTCEKSFDNAGEKTLEVYPNPVEANANVRLHGFGSGSHNVIVLNADGKKMLTQSFTGNLLNLDLSSLPIGVYVVTVDGKSMTIVKK